MLLENYLSHRLMKRTVTIVFSLTLAVLTQGIVTLLHEIDWEYLKVSELFILTLKEGLPSIPIILNLSLIVAWMSVKKELYLKKEVHSLWLSGWTAGATNRLIVSALLKISILNIFILYILAPTIRDLGPNKNTDWIHALSEQKISHPFSLSAAPNRVLIGQGLKDHTILQPVFLEFDREWNAFRSESAQIQKDTIQLNNIENITHPKDFNSVYVSAMTVPIPESSVPIAKEFYSLPELIQIGSPKLIGECIWRAGLVFLPWIVLFPFRSVAPNLHYRKEHAGEISQCLFFFSTFLVLLFLASKAPVILQ